MFQEDAVCLPCDFPVPWREADLCEFKANEFQDSQSHIVRRPCLEEEEEGGKEGKKRGRKEARRKEGPLATGRPYVFISGKEVLGRSFQRHCGGCPSREQDTFIFGFSL